MLKDFCLIRILCLLGFDLLLFVSFYEILLLIYCEQVGFSIYVVQQQEVILTVCIPCYVSFISSIFAG